MADSSTDMLVPTANDANFGFAFNDGNFADRVLRIEITSDDSFDSMSDYEGCDCVCSDNGEEVADSNDSEGSTDVKVKTFLINSQTLANKSPFFYKLFRNGMRESEQIHVTLRVYAFEEAAMIDLINFMHNNTLLATTVHDLLGVLIVADKFEVPSCMRYCAKLLLKLPVSLESAHLYFELPSSILMSEVVQPLIHAAKRYFAQRYMSLCQEEAMALPIYALEAVLSSDDFRVVSEDGLYDFILKWACEHYPNLEERREMLSKRLMCFICFSSMSSEKLKEALACPFLDHEEVDQLVLQALFFKVGLPYGQRIHAAQDQGATNRGFIGRVYKERPIKVGQLQFPRLGCVAYFDLKKEECANLFPSGRFDSKIFCLGGQRFFLSAQCNKDEQSSFHHFGLFVGMQDKPELTFLFNYELAVYRKPSEFQIKYKGNCSFTGGRLVGNQNLFDMPWNIFMADNSEYIIDGMLCLQARLSIKQLIPNLVD